MSTTFNSTPEPSSVATTRTPTMGAPERESTVPFYPQQHPQTYTHSDHTQSFRLSPQIEEEIRAAVKGSTSAGTQELDLTKWTIYKRVLRSLSLVLCIAVFLTEIVLSLQYSALDTGVGILIAVLMGIWDIWCLIHLRKHTEFVRVSKYDLLIEEVLVLGSFSTMILMVYVTNTLRFSGSDTLRGNALGVVLAILFLIHTVLICRASVDKLRSVRRDASFSYDLQMQTTSAQQQQPPPAQIIVQYVHKCSNCGAHAEPKPGEAVNEHLAARGDLQPQGISAAYFAHQH